MRVKMSPARRAALAVVLVLGVTVLGVLGTASLPGAAGGATSSVTVSMSVPSMVAIGNACTTPAAYQLGTVLPGSNALTTTNPAQVCSITFTSSNDTAMLKVAQTDGAGPAMSTPNATEVTKRSNDQTGTALRGVMGNASVGLAVGKSGTIRRTVDGGASWTSWDNVLTGGWWFDTEAVPGAPDTWVVGGGSSGTPLVAISTNVQTSAPGAPTWTDKSAALIASGWPATAEVRGVAVVTAATWFVAGDAGWVARTTTGGTSFTSYQVGGTTRHDDIDAVDANTVYMTGLSAAIYRTTTGGPNAGAWSTIAIPGGINLTGLDVRDATHVWLSNYTGTTIKYDGSAFGAQNSLPGGHFVNDIESVPGTPDMLFAVADDGTFARSSNGGTTWTQTAASTAHSLDVLAIVGATDAVVFGSGKSRWRTADGTTWALQSQDTTLPTWRASDSDPTNARRVLVAGTWGSILRSTDGGATWGGVTSGTTASLLSVSWVTSTRVWVAGAGGTILVSDDAGATWTSQTSGVGTTLRRIRGISPTVAWASGDAGVVLRTTNGGTTWTPVGPASTANLRGLAAVSATNAWAVGAGSGGGEVWRTTNGGSTWSAVVMLNAWDLPSAIATEDGTNVWMATTNEGLQRSTNGGATWSYSSLSWDALEDVDVAGAMVVASGYFYNDDISFDGGATWTSPYSGLDDPHFGVSAADGHTAYLVGGESSIMSLRERTAGAFVDDYGAGHLWASGVTSGLFGMCLQDTSAATTIGAGWTVDGDTTCTASDADPWKAVPAAQSKIGSVSSGGGAGRVDIVWGMRPKDSQPAASYSASVTFEALAPDA